MDAEEIRTRTLALRGALNALAAHVEAAQNALDEIEEASGLVDPRTGARYDKDKIG